jgi:hypothetical protein
MEVTKNLRMQLGAKKAAVFARYTRPNASKAANRVTISVALVGVYQTRM